MPSMHKHRFNNLIDLLRTVIKNNKRTCKLFNQLSPKILPIYIYIYIYIQTDRKVSYNRPDVV